MKRWSDSNHSWVEKMGGDASYLNILCIQQKAQGESPYLTVHFGPTLSMNSPVIHIAPVIFGGRLDTVLFWAVDFAFWDGVMKMFKVSFKSETDAQTFIASYKSLSAAWATNSEDEDDEIKPGVSEKSPDGLVAVEEGMCHECYNCGAFGDICDNCGHVMKEKLDNEESFASHEGLHVEKDEIHDEGEDEVSEDEFQFADTQDWPEAPFIPFCNK